MGEIGQNRFDDTPVNGQTKRGITSNWAFDEDAALRALIEATLPWTIFIDVFPTAKSNVNWDTITATGLTIHYAYKQSSGTQNDSIAWDVVLAAGTWLIELLHDKHEDRGILSIQLDSVEKGTIDFYNSERILNVRTSLSGIVIPLTTKKELKLKMTTKNGSSSGWSASIGGILLQRTA